MKYQMICVFACCAILACAEDDEGGESTTGASTSTTQSTDGSDTSDTTDSTDGTDAASATDKTDSDDSGDSADSTDATDNSEDTDGTDRATGSTNSDSTDATEASDSTDAVDSTDTPDPCAITTMNVTVESEPPCAWMSTSEERLKALGGVVLNQFEGKACLHAKGVPVDKKNEDGKSLTVQWMNHRGSNISGDHEVYVNGELSSTIGPGMGGPPFYRFTKVDVPEGDTVDVSFCSPEAVKDESWSIAEIKAIVGKPPRFGAGGNIVPPRVTLPAIAGTGSQILVTATDADTQIEPYVTMPKFSIWNGPEWAVINQDSVTWNEDEETFHNWLKLDPPIDAVGQTSFSVVVQDYQGLRVNRWFYVDVKAP